VEREELQCKNMYPLMATMNDLAGKSTVWREQYSRIKDEEIWGKGILLDLGKDLCNTC
jgi:hypothetical protein